MFLFGHLIGAWLFGKIYQKLSKKKLTRLSWGLLLLGGILPDFDYLSDFLFGTNIHRTFTHSILFVILAYFVVYWLIKERKEKKNAIFLSIGIFVHILLDMTSMPGVMLFYPLNYWISYFSINTSAILNPITLTSLQDRISFFIIDNGIGFLWLSYLYLSKQINFR